MKPTPNHARLGMFENVFLTADELDRLNESLGPSRTASLVDDLSIYLEERFDPGKDRYRRHYAVLLNWDRRELKTARSDPRNHLHDAHCHQYGCPLDPKRSLFD